MKKKVAKVLIVDDANHWLMLLRSDHPYFPNDPDLPGGTQEEGESPEEVAIREVEEEAGIVLLPENLKLLYEGSEYSSHDTVYYLYVSRMHVHQEPVISWEHASYEWVPKEEFLKIASLAKDTFMQMAYAVLSSKDTPII